MRDIACIFERELGQRVQILFKHELTCARMTDLYDQQSDIACPITILKRQMDALRALYTERGKSSNMPPLAGWADLAPFVSTGHEFDK